MRVRCVAPARRERDVELMNSTVSSHLKWQNPKPHQYQYRHGYPWQRRRTLAVFPGCPKSIVSTALQQDLRYACAQIELGALNLTLRRLIFTNRMSVSVVSASRVLQAFLHRTLQPRSLMNGHHCPLVQK